MKKQDGLENKAAMPAAAERKKVKVRVKPFRAVEGIGGPGTVAEVEAPLAEELAAIGYVEILKEDER